MSNQTSNAKSNVLTVSSLIIFIWQKFISDIRHDNQTCNKSLKIKYNPLKELHNDTITRMLLHFLVFPRKLSPLVKKNKEKSCACEEGGSHLRISFWHLLMNLKNNYLLKKLLKWVNKKCKNFNIYNIVFFFKKKKNTWKYYFTSVYQKS